MASVTAAGDGSLPGEHGDRQPPALPRPTPRIPGDPGAWVLFLGDLIVFGAFFLVFVQARTQEPAVFIAGHALLDRRLGLLNTLLLLTSSLFVALGVHSARRGRPDARLRITLAFLCGVGFVGVKVLEWSAKISHGLTPMTNDFFMYYFVFTGIHLGHVLIGLVVLLAMRSGCQSPLAEKRSLLIETGGIFWHLVDLLWIVLFSLFYVLGG